MKKVDLHYNMTMHQDEPLFSCQLCKGNGDYKKMFNIQSFNDELRVDICQWVDNKPTIKGVGMPFIRWQHLVELIPDIDGYVKDLQAGEDPLCMWRLRLCYTCQTLLPC